ncbi:MAG: AI-2E family transporter [Actinomycetota bacterium]|nr:AI-2E family transporter [Actinomycetota bacterium]
MSIFKKNLGNQNAGTAGDLAEPAPVTPPPDRDDGHTSLLTVAATYSWRFVVVVAAAALFVLLLVKLRLVVIPVIAALFITALLGPLAQRLKNKGWRPLLATWTVMLGTILFLAGLIAVIAPSVANELDDVGKSARQGFDDVLDYLARSPLKVSKADIQRYLDQAGEQIAANREKITAGVLSGAAKAVEFVTEFFLTLVLVFFFVKDGPQMFRWFERQFPPRNRRHVRAIGERSWAAIGGYLRGTAVIALVDAVLIGLTLLLVGVPLVIPLAVLTFFAAFFPLIGAVAAGIVAALVALVTGGPLDAAIVGVAILVIQQVEGDVLQPIVMGKAVSLHPVAILLALTAGAVVAGVIGAFLAVPVTAVAASIGNYVKTVNDDGGGAAETSV